MDSRLNVILVRNDGSKESKLVQSRHPRPADKKLEGQHAGFTGISNYAMLQFFIFILL
jgi:hypothetical protein